MLESIYLPLLLAQEKTTEKLATEQAAGLSPFWKFVYIIGVILFVFVLPFVLGNLLARGVRMREYGFKLGIIFTSVFLSAFILLRAFDFDEKKFDIPLGVDLKGGVILIYEIEEVKDTGDENGDEKGASGNQGVPMDDLIKRLSNRINPAGTKEIVVRQYGDRQIEIIIPEVDPQEVEEIQRLIITAGQLEFRIVANARDHGAIIEAAKEQAEGPSRFDKYVRIGDETVGVWADARQDQLKASQLDNPEDTTLRNPLDGRIITLSEIGQVTEPDQLLGDFLKDHRDSGIENIDVLLATNDDCNVTGKHLGVVSAGTDEYLNPCVNFRMKSVGAQLFRHLTTNNRPDMDASPPFYRHLGIMLDGRLITFPRLITTISDSGRITGDFTKEEVDFLVGILRAGSLPATIKKEPISENQIGSMLGDDTIAKGKISIVLSLAAVLLFVAVYYRFSGLVACAALLTNLLLIMALMVLLSAPLTLPGLAGLVLTIGMSVDANVLIFERIREELARGAAMRMAIRNGFARATTTIVDANVTTLITAAVLYVIGTDQIRGFAVTLILGIVMSMYTAIFCSRVVFDIAERRRWVTELKMMRILGSTNLDFIGKRRLAIAGSLILIVVGLVAVVSRGREIFDIDFNGGLSVTMVLNESESPEDVRQRLNEYFESTGGSVSCSVNTVSVADRAPNTVYKIDVDAHGDETRDIVWLEDSIEEIFRDASGKSQLDTYSMSFSDVSEETLNETASKKKPRSAGTGTAKKANAAAKQAKKKNAKRAETVTPEQPSEPAGDAKTKVEQEKKQPDTGAQPKKPPAGDETSLRDDLPADELLAWAGPAWTTAQEETSPPATGASDESTKTEGEANATGQDAEAEKTPADAGDEESAPSKPAPSKPAAESAQGEQPVVKTTALLSFGSDEGPEEKQVEKINAPTLREKIRTAYAQVIGSDDKSKVEVPGLIVSPNEAFNWDQESAASRQQWYVSMLVPQEQAKQVLSLMETQLESTPIYPSSSKIGGKVAGDTRNLAIAALIASLFGIVGYIWVRFQRVVFGVAAVIALVHDVLITLGAIAISAYLAKPLGFLLIDEFRISLPIVAAFLTIIGYSLNDTIVVFDRIREVRGKSPDLTIEMLNTSINQTLSRTLLTSLTTLIVVVILYAIGGSGIHGFAFALVVGVLVGTYSSIYIASPALLWMFNLNRPSVNSTK